MYNIIQSYALLLKAIQQLNYITKPVMFTNNLLLMPIGSLSIYLAIIPANGLAVNALKFMLAGADILYCIRGYILTGLLSQIETNSKELRSIIYTILVRNNHLQLNQILRLKIVLEDISCSRSHIIAHEINRNIVQMDSFQNIIKAASTLMLLSKFYTSFQ